METDKQTYRHAILDTSHFHRGPSNKTGFGFSSLQKPLYNSKYQNVVCKVNVLLHRIVAYYLRRFLFDSLEVKRWIYAKCQCCSVNKLKSIVRIAFNTTATNQ